MAFFALLGIANGVWLARIPAVKHHLRLSDGLLGIALLAAPVGLVLVVLLAGKIVDRVGSRRPVLAAAPCVALLPVALGLAPNMAVLMASLLGFGVASGMLDVAMNDQAVHVERGYQRPLMSSFHACYSFGGLAGSLFGGLFAWIGLSPAVNFLAAGAPMSVLALLAGRWLLRTPAGRRPAPPRPVPEQSPPPRPVPEQSAPERPAPERPVPERPVPEQSAPARPAPARPAPDWPVPEWPVRGRAGGTRHGGMLSGRALVASGRRPWSPAIVVLGLLALCSLLGEGAADGWSAVYMHDSLGASAGFAALGYAAFAVTMAFGRLAGDRLAARFGPVALVRGCGLLAAAGLAGALISADRVGALVGFALFGAGLSCTFPQLLSAAGNADPARPAGGIARVAGMGYVGMLGGPVMIGGLASAAGLPLALGVPVILALCIAAGADRVRPGKAARSPGRP